MRHFIKFLSVLYVLTVIPALALKPVSAQSASFQVFYDNLSPYGHWFMHPTYGYSWVPSVGGGFFPYASNGYWSYTDYGWTWVSYYPWGWAAFHYGRWDYAPEYGWFWVPDTDWGPAWVVWSDAPDYYGWAPIRPGISISVAFSSGYVPSYDRWIYCDHRYLGREDIYRYYAPRTEYGRIGGESRVINRTAIDPIRRSTVIPGPERTAVQTATGTPVRQATVVSRSQPGQVVAGNNLSLYRPSVTKGTAAKPAAVIAPKEVKQAASPVLPARGANTTHREGQSIPVAPPVTLPTPAKQPPPQTKVQTTVPPTSSRLQNREVIPKQNIPQQTKQQPTSRMPESMITHPSQSRQVQVPQQPRLMPQQTARPVTSPQLKSVQQQTARPNPAQPARSSSPPGQAHGNSQPEKRK